MFFDECLPLHRGRGLKLDKIDRKSFTKIVSLCIEGEDWNIYADTDSLHLDVSLCIEGEDWNGFFNALRKMFDMSPSA